MNEEQTPSALPPAPEPQSQPPIAEATPTPTTTASPRLESGVSLMKNASVIGMKHGTLVLENGTVIFKNDEGAVEVNVPVSSIKNIYRTATYLNFTADKKYRFTFDGHFGTTAAMGAGGVVGLAVAKNLSDKVGVEQWVEAIRQLNPNVKMGGMSFSGGMKLGLILGVILVVGIAIYVFAVVASSQ